MVLANQAELTLCESELEAIDKEVITAIEAIRSSGSGMFDQITHCERRLKRYLKIVSGFRTEILEVQDKSAQVELNLRADRFQQRVSKCYAKLEEAKRRGLTGRKEGMTTVDQMDEKTLWTKSVELMDDSSNRLRSSKLRLVDSQQLGETSVQALQSQSLVLDSVHQAVGSLADSLGKADTELGQISKRLKEDKVRGRPRRMVAPRFETLTTRSPSRRLPWFSFCSSCSPSASSWRRRSRTAERLRFRTRPSERGNHHQRNKKETHAHAHAARSLSRSRSRTQ